MEDVVGETRRRAPSRISPPGIQRSRCRRRESASPPVSRRIAPRHKAASDRLWRNREAGKQGRPAGAPEGPTTRSRRLTRYGRPEASPCSYRRLSPTCGRCRPDRRATRRAPRRKPAGRPRATSERQKQRSRAAAQLRIRPNLDRRRPSRAPEARPGYHPPPR
jgi:hypothetical protein